MKLLVISAAFPPIRAGEAEHCLQLCRQLARQDIDVHVLTTKKSSIVCDGLFKVYPSVRRWSWLALPRLIWFLKELRPDAVLLIYTGWIFNDHPMVTFLPSIAKSVLPAVGFVTQFETDRVGWRGGLFVRIVRKAVAWWAGRAHLDYSSGSLFRDSDRFIFLSRDHLTHFAEYCPNIESKSVVIPPPPLLTMNTGQGPAAARREGRTRLGLKESHFIIVFYGFIDPPKGVETLLKGFRLVSDQISYVRLVMLGGGRNQVNGAKITKAGFFSRKRMPTPYQGVHQHEQYEKKLLDMAEQFGIADKITWMQGYDSLSDEASFHLQAADVCVFPYDGGVTMNRSSVAAAAAHGLPIVTTRGTYLDPAFVDGKNVLLCSPKDPVALAAAIVSLIDNPDLRRQLSVGALELASEWFSWDTALAKTVESIRSSMVENN